MKLSSAQTVHKAKYLRQRKFFLFLPVLVMPSITILFYLLGGGANAAKAEERSSNKGLNTSLPNANIKKDSWSKLQYYEQADRDSVKRNEQVRNESSYAFNNAALSVDNRMDSTRMLSAKSRYSSYKSAARSRGISPEEAVMAKLAQIDKAMNAPSGQIKELPSGKTVTSSNADDIKRLEKFMKLVGDKSGGDEEMSQLNGMLDKIIDAQHPERVQEKILQDSVKNKQEVYSLSKDANATPVTLLRTAPIDGFLIDSNNVRSVNAFYSLDELDFTPNRHNAFSALIDETKTVTNGSTVKLRFGEDVYLAGLFVAKNTPVFGVAQLDGERLHISINSIRYENFILPISLSVFDVDGLEGIYIPGGIAGEVIKNSTDRAISGLGMGALDPSLKAQAANAGIEAAKSLLSKKVRLIKVTIKAGYQLLLKATNPS